MFTHEAASMQKFGLSELMDGIVLSQILDPEGFPLQTASVSQYPLCINCDDPDTVAGLELETVDHLGAGANAASEANMIINVAANPISELVWSPRTGLTLKYAESSSLEKNSSILWNTDLASIIVMPSKCVEDELKDNVSTSVAADVAHTIVAEPLMSSTSGTALAGKKPAQASDENVEIIPLSQLRIGERSSGLNGPVQCAETDSDERIDLNDNSIANEGAMVEKNVSSSKSGSSERSLHKRSDSGIRTCVDVNSCKLDQPNVRSMPLSSSESRENRNPVCVAKALSGPCTGESSMLGNINLAIDASGRNDEDVHRNSQQVNEDGTDWKSLMIVKSSLGKRKVGDESSSDKGARVNDGSHGSVESSNSGDAYASKKRTWIPEHTCFEANKKVKKHSDSFMNWLSSAATGHPIVRNDEPLLAVPLSSSQLVGGAHHALPLNNRQVSSEKATGFGKFFQAMYSQASLREDLNEKRASSETDDTYAANAKGKLEMLKKISTEGYRQPNVSRNINFFVGEACSSDNKIVALPDEGKPSSSSSFKDDSSSQDVRVINRNDPVLPDPSMNSTGGGDGGQNMWISRFRSIALNLEESNMNVDIPMNNLICSYAHLSPSQVKDNMVGTDKPLSEDQDIAICKNLQEGDPGDLKAIHGDLKGKAKVHPIMPSKKFRSTEDFASIFAKRLDALKNIASSKSMGGVESNTFCLYCGMRGHTLRGCSEIQESELEDLLSNFNLCGGEEDTSFLCIRCFRLTHWAVSCPYTALKQTTTDRQIGFNTFPTCANKDEASQPSHSFPIFQGVSLRVNEIFLCSDEEKTLGDAVPMDASSLKVHELIKCWKAALSNSEKALPVPNQLFHTIGRLRLSRSDLLECMNLPPPYMKLEGYFLRVRLGKWVEGLGATGYHVARIVGAEQSGSSNSSIYVDLGNLKCSVDLRYVSNHDFTQEELKAWWIANIRGDGKLPTEEELNALLLYREKPWI